MAGDNAYLFGGCGIRIDDPSKPYESAVFNETWSAGIVDTDGPIKWECLETMGDTPAPRWRHTATLLPDGSMMTFGGLCGGRRGQGGGGAWARAAILFLFDEHAAAHLGGRHCGGAAGRRTHTRSSAG